MDRYNQMERRTQLSKIQKPSDRRSDKADKVDRKREQLRGKESVRKRRTDGDKEEKGNMEKKEVGEDIGRHRGRGVVRTSHTRRARFGGWGQWGGNSQEAWEVVSDLS